MANFNTIILNFRIYDKTLNSFEFTEYIKIINKNLKTLKNHKLNFSSFSCQIYIYKTENKYINQKQIITILLINIDLDFALKTLNKNKLLTLKKCF